MKPLLPNLFTFTGLTMGRVYAIVDETAGVTLVDASLPGQEKIILNQLRRHGLAPESVRRIIITHAHPDHLGSLPALRALTGAEVWASPLEAPIIEGRAPVTAPVRRDGLGALIGPNANQRFPAVPVARLLAEGETLELGAVWQVLYTPGHTPGHIALWQADQRVALVGDVLMNLTGLSLPIPFFTWDMEQAKHSVRALAALEPTTVGFGHGPALTTHAPAQLRAFANQVG